MFFETEFDQILNLDKIISFELGNHGIWAKAVDGESYHVADLDFKSFGDNSGESREFCSDLQLVFFQMFIQTLTSLKKRAEEEGLVLSFTFVEEKVWECFLDFYEKYRKIT
jgi:hypothetical protein